MTAYDKALTVASVALIAAALWLGAVAASVWLGGKVGSSRPPASVSVRYVPPPAPGFEDRRRGNALRRWNECFLSEQERMGCINNLSVHDDVLDCEVEIERRCKAKYGWAP